MSNSSAAAADIVVRAACSITDASASCYTASWYLVWDQVRYWLLFQTPIVAASVVFEWLECSSLPHIERLRAAFDSPLTRAANHLLQIVTCAYVCIAWIVRAGSLAVSFSSWSIESALLIATAVGYGIRWVAAKQKVRFTLQLHALFDLLSVVSHFAVSIQTVAVNNTPKRSWLDFGFVRTYIAYVVVDDLWRRNTRQRTFAAQVLLVVFKALCLVFAAACVLFSLERLGDVPGTDSFLFHVYKCESVNGTHTVLSPIVGGTPDFPMCTETWSVFAAIYFVFVTVSTVGYGDFSPKTVLGQLTVCGVIVFGIYTFANESAAFMTLFGDRRSAQVTYTNGSRSTTHVIVTGNPTAAQLKDFIREFFHPDHDVVLRQQQATTRRVGDSVADDHIDDSDRLERGRAASNEAADRASSTRPFGTATARIRETHIVVLLQFESDDAQTAFETDVTDFVADNQLYHKRVVLVAGSPLRRSDLIDRAKLRHARAVFFLPNKFATDGNQEDAATVLRVLAVTQVQALGTQLFAMLVHATNRTLLEATGLPRDHIVCADELRLGLMGLSCRCPGLSTLVSNLITSRSSDGIVSESESDSDIPNQKSWLAEYVAGAANEIYACALAPRFADWTFTAVAQDVHAASQGLVLLIAVELDGELAINPGRHVQLPLACRAFWIAESIAALAPFAAAAPSLLKTVGAGGTSGANLAFVRACTNLVARAKRAQHTVERRIPFDVRSYIQQVSLTGNSSPTDATTDRLKAPSQTLLAKGGHIVVCSNAAEDGSGQRSVARLVHFLKPLRAAHVEHTVPIVLVDAERLDRVSRLALEPFRDVYHVEGSPQRHSVLVAAGVYSASAIVVLAQGTASAGADDSNAIFNAVLVNAALQRSSSSRSVFTIIELRDVTNNRFLDPVVSFQSSRSYDDDDAIDSLGGRRSADSVDSSRLSRRRLSRSTIGGPTGSRLSRSRKSSAPLRRSWLTRHVQACRLALLHVQTFFLGNLVSAAHRVHAFQTTTGSGSDTGPMLPGSTDSDTSDDTFYQERFMRGALFPSYVADDLLIQSFFNPSLNAFVRQLVDGTSCFMLYNIPQAWRSVSQPPTYGALFAAMTAGPANALPIGLLRARGGPTGAPYPYVYTCPAASTLVYPDDKLFVLLDAHALHHVANKLQRWFRNRRKGENDAVAVADTVDAAER